MHLSGWYIDSAAVVSRHARRNLVC